MRMGKGRVCAISLGGFQPLCRSAKTALRGSSEQTQREEDGKSRGPRTAGACEGTQMTDASVSVPTVAALWEQRRCLRPTPLLHTPPSPTQPQSHRPPHPTPRQGRDGGITRQEQSSQRYSDRTGTALHADEEEER